MKRRYYSDMASPIGPLTLASDGRNLTAVWMHSRDTMLERMREFDWRESEAYTAQAREQLESYFAGELRAFTLPLAPEGTDFQKRVWAALAAIPFGATRSYGEIATAIGARGAARAVGAANGRNPIAIVVPCHRVIGANGSLTGYGGGMARKQYLLEHEVRVGP